MWSRHTSWKRRCRGYSFLD
uniref:Uncharacterized protein n=1 Tax=Anguilla anguilla TaxID=7936 RepID=A0A0E9RM96_ANGAN